MFRRMIGFLARFLVRAENISKMPGPLVRVFSTRVLSAVIIFLAGAIIAIAVRDWVTIVLAVAVAVYIVYTAYRTVKDGLGDNYVCIVGTCIDIERNASANLTRGKAGRVKSLAMETPDGLVFRIILSGHREAKTMRGLREGDVLEMYVSKSTLFISQNDEYVIRQFYTLQRSDKRTIDIVRKELSSIFENVPKKF